MSRRTTFEGWSGLQFAAMTLALTLALTLAQIGAASPALAESPEPLAVHGETVYPVSGPPIADGVVLLRDGKVEAVGAAAAVPVPAGYRQLRGVFVTPGLIDAHSTVGLSGIYNSAAAVGGGGRAVHDQDQLERSSPIQPQLRAVDAYDAREALVTWLRDYGITTVHTGHGPGALISGQTMIVKTAGDTVEEAVVVPEAMLAVTLGPQVGRTYESPGTRAKGVAMLRQKLLEARHHAQQAETAEEPPKRDLELEALGRLLAGEVPALITAHRSTEILAALRLAREFGFRWVLDGAAEAHLLVDELRDAEVPVIVHPTMIRPRGETRNFTFETLGRLRRAGIPATLQSGHEPYVPKVRVVLLEAAMAVAYGLPPEEALAALTLDAARILGVDERVGSLEPGKDGDLVVFDGDPFEHTSHVCAVVIDGAVVSEECK